MCSSPKSSATIRKSRLKGVFEDMDPNTRASFVAKANAAADKRSALKNESAKRNNTNPHKEVTSQREFKRA